MGQGKERSDHNALADYREGLGGVFGGFWLAAMNFGWVGLKKSQTCIALPPSPSNQIRMPLGISFLLCFQQLPIKVPFSAITH